MIKPADVPPRRTSSEWVGKRQYLTIAVVSASDEAAAGGNDVRERAAADADLQHAAVKRARQVLASNV